MLPLLVLLLLAECELDDGCVAQTLQTYEWLIRAMMQQQEAAGTRAQTARIHGTVPRMALLALGTMQEGYPTDSITLRVAFSCVTSCLKAIDSISASSSCSSSSSTSSSISSSDRVKNLQVCYECTWVALEWLGQAASPQGPQQQQQQAQQQQPGDEQQQPAADYLQQLALLCARTLSLYGRILGKLVDTARNIQSTQPGVSSPGALASGSALLFDTVKADHIVAVQRCVDKVGVSLQGLQLPGEPAAATEALQQLQTQQAQLLLSLQDMARNIPALQALEAAAGISFGHTSSSRLRSSSPEAAAAAAAAQRQLDSIAAFAELPPQLQQFGDAVCSQTPAGVWCCNPSCVRLQGVSEQEPVAGKGCLCSRCKTARFCCYACIEECYKEQHKKVCKRIARHAAAKQG
jgi:hypothetical protein